MGARMSDRIVFEIRDSVGWLTLNRPEQRNALTFEMYERIRQICETLNPSEAKSLVICGAGGEAFAAGTDMSEFCAFSTPQDAIAYEADMDAVFTAIERCPVPTVAAITGACTGGGGAIAACCDLRISDRALKFGFPIARTLGNCLAVKTLSRLTALIGHARVSEMIFTARLIGAEEALSVALVSEVHADADAVMARAEELAQMMAGFAPLTLRAAKEALRRLRFEGAGANDDDLVTQCYMSSDLREGISAFLGKRKPNWQGE